MSPKARLSVIFLQYLVWVGVLSRMGTYLGHTLKSVARRSQRLAATRSPRHLPFFMASGRRFFNSESAAILHTWVQASLLVSQQQVEPFYRCSSCTRSANPSCRCTPSISFHHIKDSRATSPSSRAGHDRWIVAALSWQVLKAGRAVPADARRRARSLVLGLFADVAGPAPRAPAHPFLRATRSASRAQLCAPATSACRARSSCLHPAPVLRLFR